MPVFMCCSLKHFLFPLPFCTIGKDLVPDQDPTNLVPDPGQDQQAMVVSEKRKRKKKKRNQAAVIKIRTRVTTKCLKKLNDQLKEIR